MKKSIFAFISLIIAVCLWAQYSKIETVRDEIKPAAESEKDEEDIDSAYFMDVIYPSICKLADSSERYGFDEAVRMEYRERGETITDEEIEWIKRESRKFLNEQYGY